MKTLFTKFRLLPDKSGLTYCMKTDKLKVDLSGPYGNIIELISLVNYLFDKKIELDFKRSYEDTISLIESEFPKIEFIN